jgi:hypothetical protein
VAFVCVFSCDFTGSSKLKTLFCTGIGFHFWHNSIYLFLDINVSQRFPFVASVHFNFTHQLVLFTSLLL